MKLNAYAERWVRLVKEERLSKVIRFGERSLRRALSEYVEHYHAERNHQGKDNVLLFARDTSVRRTGPVQCRERLGGCVKKTRKRHAVGEMKDGPSESPCRRRLQTAMSCFGQKPRWLTSWLKGAALTASCMDERDERKRSSG